MRPDTCKAKSRALIGSFHFLLNASLATFCLLALALPGRAEEKAVADKPAADKPAVKEEKPLPKPPVEDPAWYTRFSGVSRSVYEYKTAGSEKDQDFYQYLYVSGSDLANKRLDVYFSGKLHRDLDGKTVSLADNMYSSVEDTSKTVDDYLYELYAELHDQSKMVRLRAGRQYVDVADGLQIDGAQLMVNEGGRFGGRLFYGLPVSYYTSVSGDQAYGGSLVGKPWLQNESRVTYARYHDHAADVEDDRYVVDTRQRFMDEFVGRASFSELNNEFEQAGMDVMYAPVHSDFDASFGARRWGAANGESRAYSPLTQYLGMREAYTYLNGRFSVGVLPGLYVSPGVTARMMNSGDENAHNRDYMRYDVTLTAEPDKAWSTSLAGEYWNVNAGDSFFGLSGDVRYRYKRLWELSAGAGYTHYQYQQYTDFSGTIDAGDVQYNSDGTIVESSPDSYSYYLRGKWYITKAVSVGLRGELEDNSEIHQTSFRGQSDLVIRF